MDGIHDLGGKLGFGAIDVTGDEEAPFHATWEERMWGVALAYTRPADWNAPMFRYTRELEEPVRYLTRPYFDQWYKAHACMLAGAGLVSIDELASGTAAGTAPTLARAPMSVADVHNNKHAIEPAMRGDDVAPKYAIGEWVFARNTSPPGHTRLPAYVRGHPGVITACHGGQALDDAAANGVSRIETLYTVRFNLSDLFPECMPSPDRVHLDLWESHLGATEPAPND